MSRLPAMPQIDEEQVRRSLGHASHFITNRQLSTAELGFLEAESFEPIHEDAVPLPEAAFLQLWVRTQGSRTPRD